MSTTTIGEGIVPIDMPAEDTPEPGPVDMPTQDTPGAGLDIEAIKASVRMELRGEFDAAVADVERRLAQSREMEMAAFSGVPRESVHAEDLNVRKHLLDGYLLTANTPVAGSIAWSSLHVVFMGVDYTITDGNTANKYAWFIKPGSGTTATLQTGNTLPVLGANDALIFVNNAGVPVSALETSISYAVGPGVIGSAQLATDVATVLSTLQANDIAQQSALDGAITTYYQDAMPWSEDAPSPAGGNQNMGDVWYDSNDGGAFRWTGATPGSGVTANKWVRIADTSTAEIAAKVGTKTTTYLLPTTTPPVAPTGGFTTGDLWMKTNQNNLLARWSGSAWVDLQLGDAAISGIGGAKVGTGIIATNITSGTLAAARVGAGVNGAVLTTATGTVGNTQIAANAVTPAKINAAFHLLY